MPIPEHHLFSRQWWSACPLNYPKMADGGILEIQTRKGSICFQGSVST
jgi:hypothetical protein